MLDSFDEEDCAEETGLITEKKKRLSFDQVKALERSFEIENKLEPERKVKIAEELGLKPRQVAIWFQNRRARWKTKQLERDYGILKANYDALKLDYESLEQEKEALVAELRELKAKLQGGNMELNQSVKEEALWERDRPKAAVTMTLNSSKSELPLSEDGPITPSFCHPRLTVNALWNLACQPLS
uniref:Homeobox-leucine zipper protein n=1 Tax=Vitis vinifera TaxID=29760 RepID=A5BV79_VITVI|nr:hypothetical protein VITISV_016259 [Vitis vinifera]